jgi:ribosome recycling factor
MLKNKVFFFPSTVREYSNYRHCITNSCLNAKDCTKVLTNNTSILKQMAISNFILSRNIYLSKIDYAKNKAKEKKKSKSVNLDLREVSEVYNVEKLKEQFQKSVENMKQEYVKNFALRSTSGSIELIPIKLEDKEYEIQELAQIVRSPKTVILNVNFPTAIPLIIKAIQNSGLNINPQQDGTTISLPIPK